MTWRDLIFAAIGFVGGSLVASFFSAIGSDLWLFVKKKATPAEPQELQVERRFQAPGLREKSCRWILDTYLPDWEARGFKRYCKDGRPVYRLTYHPENGNMKELYVFYDGKGKPEIE